MSTCNNACLGISINIHRIFAAVRIEYSRAEIVMFMVRIYGPYRTDMGVVRRALDKACVMCSLMLIRVIAFVLRVPPHFLPFFFFFPPAPPGTPEAGIPPIFTSPSALVSGTGVDVPSPLAGALRSSGASGSAAISRPSRPRLPISRPTSAALFVSYCKHVPDSGSYVLSVKVVVASSGFCDCGGGDDVREVSAGLSACFAVYFSRFLIFDAVGFRTAYLEVMRVCSCRQIGSREQAGRECTVVGLALSSNDDCSYHSALVLKYGISKVGW